MKPRSAGLPSTRLPLPRKVQGREALEPGVVCETQVVLTPWGGWGGLETARDDVGPRFTQILESPLLYHHLKAPGAKRVGTRVGEGQLHGDRPTTCARLTCFSDPTVSHMWPIITHVTLHSNSPAHWPRALETGSAWHLAGTQHNTAYSTVWRPALHLQKVRVKIPSKPGVACMLLSRN